MATSLVLMALVVPAGAARGASTAGFPSGFEGYHDYAEATASLQQTVEDHPAIARLSSIGLSHEGRDIWAVKISDNVSADESEPEVLMDSLHHAREHLTVEMALRVIELLTDNYRSNPANITTPLQQRVTDIVRSREIWIVPMVNPDGGEYDLSLPTGEFRNWRRNTQPIVETAAPGIDLNRNWGYQWGCCAGSSGQPGTSQYRGEHAWQAPEVAAVRDFVLGRVVNGRQQIRAAISWHAYNEEIMWPYGYTTADAPRTMSPDDSVTFRALGEGMAALNSYTAQQLSDLYVLDGGAGDWLYGDQRIFAYTIEMYPTAGTESAFYPPDAVIAQETTRNDEMVLYFLEQADCPYRSAGLATTHCGPLNDDFEAARGWQFNPRGTDTATLGLWQRAAAEKSRSSTGIKQRAYGYSGSASLVTGAALGGSATANDVDSGVTSVESPAIPLRGTGTTGWTLAFQYSFAHNSAATAADTLRISVNGTTVFAQAGNRRSRNATWTPVTLSLDAFAGQTVQILIAAVDAGGDSLVEAAVDDIRVYQLP